MAPQRVEIGIHSLADGTMKEVPFPKPDSEGKILLSKVKGSYYATSATCTHYGARASEQSPQKGVIELENGAD